VQFVLFDISATLVFLVGYLAAVALQRRRALPVAMGAGGTLSREARPMPSPERRRSPEGPTTRPPRREWPRLSYPR